MSDANRSTHDQNDKNKEEKVKTIKIEFPPKI
jgi:hypothetical protein